MCDTGIGIGTPFKHPAPDLLFRFNGREIRKRQIMLAFKVDPVKGGLKIYQLDGAKRNQ
jgi:hypothetical protein